MPSTPAPTLDVERALLDRGAASVAGMDEVGRGAIAGPVTLGVVVVSASTPPAPEGIRDSKELTARARERLVPAITTWAMDWAVGHASAEEVDEVGIMAAMRRAGLRALRSLRELPGVILLDGPHDYLTRGRDDGSESRAGLPPVLTQAGADRTCASVSAASVIAKVTRDRVMADLAEQYPDFGWQRNRGYGSPEHRAALAACGPSPMHRRSFGR